MRSARTFVTGLSLLGVLGLSAVQAQRGEKDAPGSRELDAKVVTVRLLLGLDDRASMDWGGKVAIDKGEVIAVDGWRFRQGDEVRDGKSWTAWTRTSGKQAGKKAAAKKKAAVVKAPGASAPGAGVGPTVPNGVFVAVKAPDDARLSVETEQGKFAVALADLADGSTRRYLNGKVEAQVVPTGVPLYDGPDQEDFPAAAADEKGDAWVALVVHQARGPATLAQLKERPKSFGDSVPTGGGDQVRLLRFAGGKAGDSLDVTDAGRDVWRPAVAVNGAGNVVVVWSEFRDGNWDLQQRAYSPAKRSWSEPKRLTKNAGADADAVLATAPDGKVWMAWQCWNDGQADILLAPVDDPASPVRVSEGSSNEWSPSIAIDKGGRIHVAYDTYQAGNYDIQLRTRGADGTLGSVRAVASSPLFEARPSVTADPQGRAWVAYEERTRDWGKDAENLQQGDGTTLYRSSAVRVRCVDGDRLLDAPDPVADAPGPLRLMNSFPRIASDRSGRIWLAYRHRQDPRNSGVGGAWVEHVSSLAGKAWTAPAVLPGSDGMLDNRAAIVVPNDGPVLAFYDGDGRLSRDGDSVDHGLHVAALTTPSGGAKTVDPALAESAKAKGDDAPPLHPNEAADIARLRAHRVTAGGKTYRLLRGEFHRHTEISADGGNDGALEDMWRYALDCANLDWIGNGDHDNGGGKEYTWWLIQKTTDLYHSPARFTPMFTYERSVQFPHGHRNVMWDRRGIRTLPRLAGGMAIGISEDDTKMLYDYLNELGGICASHTTGTSGMGTDWRDNDPMVEPVVEIFQGHRNSYEALGEPRVARRSSEAIGGFQPYGMVWNALAMQYKLGFESSSDHISTHISYGIAIAEEHSRSAILDAFKKRHCYAATDNILLDVRCGDHLMGDEFDADGPVRLKINVHGTRPIRRIDVIKDFRHAYTTEPGSDRVAFEWTDDERRPAGLSWYYVRAIQDDGELAWGSPFWVHHAANEAGE